MSAMKLLPLTTLKVRTAKARATHAYRAEGASLRFTGDLLAQMKSRGVTRSALAGMIGTPPAYITKILRGETNFTLDTMVKIAHALDCEVSVQLSPLASTQGSKAVNAVSRPNRRL